MIAAAASSSSRVESRSAGSKCCSKRSMQKSLTRRLHVSRKRGHAAVPLPAAARPGAQSLSRAQDLRAYARCDLFLHQRTFALVERTPRLFRGDGRELLVVVPGRLALLRLLHLE